VQCQGVTDRASFPIGSYDNHTAEGLHAIGQGLQSRGMDTIVIRQ
jgi:hypothetical protein